jgi:signal transduction histidine kinase
VLWRFYHLRNQSAKALAERNLMIVAQNAQLSLSSEELKKLNQAKDRFFSIVAHDLRSPISSLAGLIRLFKESGLDLSQEETATLVDEISLQLDSVSGLLNDLLFWARNQMTQATFKPEMLEVAESGRKVLALFALEATTKRIELREHLPNGVLVRADRNMLDFILRNLVANSLKFTPMGGQIDLAAEVVDNMVHLTVCDTGVGITPEKLADIFDPLKYSLSTGTAGETGSGLGLPLCKEFVERHGGQIWVQPNQPQGSLFGFSLPRG